MNTLPLRQLCAYRAMHDGFSRCGLDLDAFLLGEGGVGSLDAVLPAETLADLFDAAWRHAVARTQDPAIGLRMTPRQPMIGLGGMAHLVMAAPDIRTALQRLERFTGVISPTTAMSVQLVEGQVRVGVEVSPGARPAASQRYDFMAYTVLQGIWWLLGQQMLPERVFCPFPAPEDTGPWEKAYGAPVQFGAAVYAMDFPRRLLDMPVPTADPMIADLSEQLAERLIAQQGGSLVARVREVIARQLSRGDPRREQVAAELRMSERTLQRHLSDQGTSFQDLVDDTRRETARRLLEAGGATPTEVSFALGFADPSTFYRACKRWFGCSPSEFRCAH